MLINESIYAERGRGRKGRVSGRIARPAEICVSGFDKIHFGTDPLDRLRNACRGQRKLVWPVHSGQRYDRRQWTDEATA